MSIQFSDTSTKKGLVQIYEDEIGVNDGDISGNTTKLKKFTADVNLALDDYFAIALTASGTWQLDDSNQTSYPIVTANLVSGQRDYPFTTDTDGNLILDIYKVLIADSTGVYHEIFPIDVQSDKDTQAFYDGINASGFPGRYDKTANGIFLEYLPDYNYTNGIKIYVNREASYFVSTDTTKKPGVPGLHHRYFAIKPAMQYARRNGLTSLPSLTKEVLDFEGDEKLGITGSIAKHFGKREKDKRSIMTPKKINYI